MAALRGHQYEHIEMENLWKDEYDPHLYAGYSLKPWQKLGITFLHQCRAKLGYALLGDEMGVGKVFSHFQENN
jgi:hypothetical protein